MIGKVLTANDLLGGNVVYFGADQRWHRHFRAARLLSLDTADAALLMAGKTVVGAHLTAAEIDDNGDLQPLHIREHLRARGPSNRFLGKQAEADFQDNHDVRVF